MPSKKRKASELDKTYTAKITVSSTQARTLHAMVDRIAVPGAPQDANVEVCLRPNRNSQAFPRTDGRMGMKQNEQGAVDQSDKIPWTSREELEILRIYRDHNNTGREQKAEILHDMMSRIRRCNHETQKPARTAAELTSKVRELKNTGVTIEALEDMLFPPPPIVSPAKRKDTERSYDPEQEYSAREILAESATHFKISWEDDEETGEQFSATWEPKEFANQWLIDHWEDVKGRREAET